MANEPVFVPIELDIDIDLKNIKTAHADLTKKLKSLTASMNDILSKVDSSKFGTNLSKALNNLTRDYNTVITAQQRYVKSVKEAEVSDASYAAMYEQISRNLKTNLRGMISTTSGAAKEMYTQRAKTNLYALKQLGSGFDYATPESLQKLSEDYKSLFLKISELNDAGETFNKTVQDSRLSEEYKAAQAEMDQLTQKLGALEAKSKKMLAIGATDSAWKSLTYDAEMYKQQIDDIAKKMTKLVDSGEAFTFGPRRGERVKTRGDISRAGARGASSVKNILGDYEQKSVQEARLEAEQAAQKIQQDAIKAIEAIIAKLATLNEKADKMSALGGTEKQWDSLAYDADVYKAKIEELIELLRSLGLTTEADSFAQKMLQNADAITAKYQEAKEAMKPPEPTIWQRFTEMFKEAGKSMETSSNSAKSSLYGIQRISSNIVKNFNKMGKNALPKLRGGIRKLWKNILMFGLGFRTMYFFVKRLRKIATEGLTAMAKKFDDINKPLSETLTKFTQLKGALSTAIQPIVMAMLPLLNALIDTLSIAAEKVATFFAALTGQDYIMKAIANQKDFAKQMEKTQKLADYDELKLVGDTPDVDYEKIAIDVASMGGIFGNLLEDFKKLGEIISFVWSKFKGIAGELSEALSPVFSQVVDILDRLKEPFMDLLGSIAGFVADMADDVIGTIGTILESLLDSALKVFEEIQPYLTNIVQTILPVLDRIVDALLPELEKILPKIFEVVDKITSILAPMIADAVEILAPVAGDIIVMLLDSLSSALDLITPILEDIGNTLFPAIADILEALKEPLQNVFDLLVGILGNVLVEIAPLIEMLTPVIIELTNTAFAILTPLLELAGKLLKRLLNIFMVLIEPILLLIEPLLELITSIFEPLMEILDPILDRLLWLVEIFAMLLQPVLELIAPLISLVQIILVPLIELLAVLFAAMEPISDIFKFVATVITTILMVAIKALVVLLNLIIGVFKLLSDVVSMVMKAIREAFDKVWNPIKEVLNGILGGIESLINGIINGINTMVRALNKLSFKVPDWVPLIGGKSFGFNLQEIASVRIPRLAQGAVIPPNREFLAMLGDQRSGTNIEAPLDTIKQALLEVMSELGGSNAPIVLKLDGRTIAEVVWDEGQKRYKQTGRPVGAY